MENSKQKYYHMTVAGLERDLPICRLNDDLQIAGFVIFGDTELTTACAAELNALVPEYDYAISAEAKGIPLVHEMARLDGNRRYVLARKAPKLYMTGVFGVEVKSITTSQVQHLYLDVTDAELMRGKRILIVDDVVSTGESLHALETLVREAGGIICGEATILVEGDADERFPNLIHIGKIPLFDSNCKVIGEDPNPTAYVKE